MKPTFVVGVSRGGDDSCVRDGAGKIWGAIGGFVATAAATVVTGTGTA